MGSAQTRKFFEKNLTKNFRAWVQCEHRLFDGRAQALRQKIKPPASKFLKDRGVGKGKLLSRSFLPRLKNIKSTIRFFFGTRGAKKKLGKKKTPFLWGYSPQTPASFLKKTWLKTFKLWCSANIMRSTVERRHYGKKIKPQFQNFWKMG